MSKNENTPWAFKIPQAEVLLYLGIFVSLYSSVERAVHMVFYKYSGLKEEAGRAVCGGMRLIDVMAMIKRLVVARKLDQQIYDDLDEIFGLISALSSYRDKVIHRQWLPEGDKKEVSILNLASAKSSASIEEYVVTAQELHLKYKETQNLLIRLYTHTLTKKRWQYLSQNSYAVSPAPWFEKLGPPASSPQQLHKTARSPRRRRPS